MVTEHITKPSTFIPLPEDPYVKYPTKSTEITYSKPVRSTSETKTGYKTPTYSPIVKDPHGASYEPKTGYPHSHAKQGPSSVTTVHGDPYKERGGLRSELLSKVHVKSNSSYSYSSSAAYSRSLRHRSHHSHLDHNAPYDPFANSNYASLSDSYDPFSKSDQS